RAACAGRRAALDGLVRRDAAQSERGPGLVRARLRARLPLGRRRRAGALRGAGARPPAARGRSGRALMEIIPSIDLRAGRVARLERADAPGGTVDEADPAEVARGFVRAGATRIHVVDLDGARDGGEPNRIASGAILAAAGHVPVQLGGGMRTLEQIDAAL